MIIHIICNIKNNLINSMIIYIIENKRLSKTKKYNNV